MGSHNPRLRLIARRCLGKGKPHFRSANDLHMALQGRNNSRLLVWILAFLVVMLAVLAWLSSGYAPQP